LSYASALPPRACADDILSNLEINDLRTDFKLSMKLMGIPTHGWQYEVLICPFCKKGKINCMWFPSSVSVKRNVTVSLPGHVSLSKNKESWIIKSGCPECSKSLEEVEKEYQRKVSYDCNFKHFYWKVR
jgi:hypothetical protein